MLADLPYRVVGLCCRDLSGVRRVRLWFHALRLPSLLLDGWLCFVDEQRFLPSIGELDLLTLCFHEAWLLFAL